ncbi:hypothetical protein OA88_09950 [Flavobacterium sp. JRM]|nr:hypothetical protein OA88_09950 [Flavobacterium sp. JRM]
MENQLSENHEKFLNFLENIKKEEEKITSSETYKIIDELSKNYLEQGKTKAYILASDIDTEKKLSSDFYSELIEIYFFENKQALKNEYNDSRIEIIEFIGASFEDNALNYLDKYAFIECDEQIYALKLLLLYAQLNNRKEITFNKITANFKNFNKDLQDLLKKFIRLEFPHDSINRELKSNKNEQSFLKKILNICKIK